MDLSLLYLIPVIALGLIIYHLPPVRARRRQRAIAAAPIKDWLKRAKVLLAIEDTEKRYQALQDFPVPPSYPDGFAGTVKDIKARIDDTYWQYERVIKERATARLFLRQLMDETNLELRVQRLESFLGTHFSDLSLYDDLDDADVTFVDKAELEKVIKTTLADIENKVAAHVNAIRLGSDQDYIELVNMLGQWPRRFEPFYASQTGQSMRSLLPSDWLELQAGVSKTR